MISFMIMRKEGIVVIEPAGALEGSDFERLTREVDDYINEKGIVNGLIIHTKEFPGWKSFSAFSHHMKFVKDHHQRIRRVAVVTDSQFMTIGPTIANHFVSAKIKHFPYSDMDSAKEWILEEA